MNPALSLNQQKSDNEFTRNSSPPPSYSKYQVNLIRNSQKAEILKRLNSIRKMSLTQLQYIQSQNITPLKVQLNLQKLELSNFKMTSDEINQLPESPAQEFSINKYIILV